MAAKLRKLENRAEIKRAQMVSREGCRKLIVERKSLQYP